MGYIMEFSAGLEAGSKDHEERFPSKEREAGKETHGVPTEATREGGMTEATRGGEMTGVTIEGGTTGAAAGMDAGWAERSGAAGERSAGIGRSGAAAGRTICPWRKPTSCAPSWDSPHSDKFCEAVLPVFIIQMKGQLVLLL